MHNGVLITTQGEAALRVQFTSGDSDTRWQHVRRLVAHLKTLALPAVEGVAATYDSVLIEFDSLRISAENLQAVLDYASVPDDGSEATPAHEPEPRRFRLPVCYGGHDGPDLERVAELFGESADTLAQVHAARWHLIRAYGAPAASPLMDGLNTAVSVPRRTSPRVRVPSGSLALAGIQSIIYSVPAPGGWQLIGHTPVELVSTRRQEVCAYDAGDHIGYFPITRREWSRYEGRPMKEFGV